MIKPKLHIDLQWLNKISINLPLFRKIKKDTFNARCIICGDSQKSKKLARFYAYTRKGQLNVCCKNCGYSHSFYKFMKDQFGSMFEEYKRETLFDALHTRRDPNTSQHTAPTLDATESAVGPLMPLAEFKKNATHMLDLDPEHPARVYMESRAFTERELKRLYYTDSFKELAEKINPESAERLKNEPRIIIPFINPNGEVEMIQGRSLDPKSTIKYLSIKAHDDISKIYGLYELDEAMTSYCVEGPLDSLFVDNCVASCDGSLTRVQADVYIWDNQPRNKDVVRYMEEAIENGHSLVIWPYTNGAKMDINDMIKMGLTQTQLMQVIEKSTFSGLMAKAKFIQWKKV